MLCYHHRKDGVRGSFFLSLFFFFFVSLTPLPPPRPFDLAFMRSVGKDPMSICCRRCQKGKRETHAMLRNGEPRIGWAGSLWRLHALWMWYVREGMHACMFPFPVHANHSD